jgi:uncharacterized membrane protein YozB (DUF420 family)
MVSLLVAQVNLIFQAAVFVLLVIGFMIVRKRKIKSHAQVMLAAVVLNLVSFMAIMAPATRSVASGDSGDPAFIAIAHGTIGAIALLLGIWVVGIWLMRPLMAVPARLQCYGALNKKLMLAVLFLWFTSLILGFVLYASLYAKLL